MARFRTRPVEVEAVQWLADGDHHAVIHDGTNGQRYIDTRSGRQAVEPGDWIIAETDGSGQHYPCKPHIFAERYEAIDERKQGAQIGGDRPGAFQDYVPERRAIAVDAGHATGDEPHNRFGGGGQTPDPMRDPMHQDKPKVQQPSVGRIVHFYTGWNGDQDWDREPNKRKGPYPAIITLVHDDGSADVHVLGSPTVGLMRRVPFGDDGVTPGAFLQWPPHVPAK